MDRRRFSRRLRPVVTPWEEAVQTEDARDWVNQTFRVLYEWDELRPEGFAKLQAFARIEPLISEDGRTVGLGVTVLDGDMYNSDGDDGPFSLWLSRADAQVLGQALLKQSVGHLEGDESIMLLSPENYQSPRKEEVAADKAEAEAVAA